MYHLTQFQTWNTLSASLKFDSKIKDLKLKLFIQMIQENLMNLALILDQKYHGVNLKKQI